MPKGSVCLVRPIPSLEDGADIGRYLLEFVIGQFQLGITEEHVLFRVQRDKMNVCVWHLQSKDGLADLDTAKHFFLSNSDLFGKKLQVAQLPVGKVEQVVNLALRDTQHMTAYQWIDIQECKAVFSFSYFIAGDITFDYFAEDCHNSPF